MNNNENNNDYNDYHVNLICPKTLYTKNHARLVIYTLIVWAIAVFGFQILLKIFEKPTKELSYQQFENVWPKVVSGSYSNDDIKVFLNSSLNIYGRALSANEKESIQEVITWSISNILPQNSKEEIDHLIEGKRYKEISNQLSSFISFPDEKVKSNLLPYALIRTGNVENLLNKNIQIIPVIMKKYLIHRRSFLTDSNFLGFPFHYWYTAEFLLILFVFLCWFYCYKLKKINKHHNYQESN